MEDTRLEARLMVGIFNTNIEIITRFRGNRTTIEEERAKRSILNTLMGYGEEVNAVS